MITSESSFAFVKKLIKSGHESVLEHAIISVKITCDRGVSHELVRHRIASFSQESTRYCNYGKEGHVTYIIPPCVDIDAGEYKNDSLVKIDYSRLNNPDRVWFWSLLKAEHDYLQLLNDGWSPQMARSVLPNSLKTEIVITMNLREWRHFFKLRALGVAGAPHPQMLEITVPMLIYFAALLPAVFEDLIETLRAAEKEKNL